MSAKKPTNSILNYFSKKATKAPNSTGDCSLPVKAKKATDSDPKDRSLNESTASNCEDKTISEKEAEELTRLCLEDDDESDIEVKEESPVKKKRKRIQMLDSSSDDDYEYEGSDDESNYTPKKKQRQDKSKNTPKLKELQGSSKGTPKSSSKLAKTLSKFSTPKEKENSSPPGSSTKSKLAAFASPSVKDDEDDFGDSDKKEKDDEGEEGETVTFNHPHLNYKFLDPKHIRDMHRRSPDDPDYDDCTLHVPESFLKDLTPAQRQWWEIKIRHFDTVLFFKMGKFYELFHMDAVLGVEICGLTFMPNKPIAHCGFPESSFQQYADVLINKGFKVARIEQTETPEDNAERCKKMARATKFDKVVRREVCQVTTPGTRINTTANEMCYLTALCGLKSEDDNVIKIGVCFLDTSIGRIFLGQFDDHKGLSKLETLLALCPPSEVLFDKSKCPQSLKDILDKFTATKKQNSSRSSSFPESTATLEKLHKYQAFDTKDDWPQELKEHLDESDSVGLHGRKESELALSALGAIINYLSDNLIDEYVLNMKQFTNVKPIDLERSLGADSIAENLPPGSNMILDNKTLSNLDIPSLFKVVNKTVTAMGKRLLKQWTFLPLLRTKDIADRQAAVRFFESNTGMVEVFRDNLKGLPDLERLVASVARSGVKLSSDHPEQRAIYYTQDFSSARKIKKLLQCLDGFVRIKQFFEAVQDDLAASEAKLIKNLIPVDVLAELSERLTFFKKAFNRKQAEETGKIIPKEGVDDDYDRVCEDKRQLENDLEKYLNEQKRHFGSRDVKYFGKPPNHYQIEVPEAFAKKADSRYTVSSNRKGFKRYTTEETKNFVTRLAQVEDFEQEVLSEVSRRIFNKFSESRLLWEQLIHVVATADALLSLFTYSSDQDVFPEFLSPNEAGGRPVLKVVQGRHPIVIALNPDIAYIPNNFSLDDKLAILTGANMGGKSTLMRQTALLTVLAQMGCRVPAEEMSLTPVDRIFTRIGANDNIFERESTFFVELTETRIILDYANVHSLVLIDELGRGTTTFDGCSIAYAVAKYLTSKKCRTIFSTHYHELIRKFEAAEDIKIYHMGVVEDEAEKSVVFLYTVSEGPCSKSHGFNAARMAGLPTDIIEASLSVANQFENEHTNLMALGKILQEQKS